jgi:hypothetical protein
MRKPSHGRLDTSADRHSSKAIVVVSWLLRPSFMVNCIDAVGRMAGRFMAVSTSSVYGNCPHTSEMPMQRLTRRQRGRFISPTLFGEVKFPQEVATSGCRILSKHRFAVFRCLLSSLENDHGWRGHQDPFVSREYFIAGHSVLSNGAKTQPWDGPPGRTMPNPWIYTPLALPEGRLI